MGQFFVPALPEGGHASEEAYRALRDRAEACTGEVSRERRIELLECRRSGRDCLLRVGEPDTATGQVVAAIIQVGRGTYTVHHVSNGVQGSPEPVVLQQSDIYSVTDFQ